MRTSLSPAVSRVSSEDRLRDGLGGVVTILAMVFIPEWEATAENRPTN